VTETTELELQAPDSEKALIGAAGYYPDAIAATLQRLPGHDFYDLVRGTVWDTCRKLSADREPITPVTVARRMVADQAWSQRAERIVQAEMSTASPAAHADRHADIVADLAQRRLLLRAVNRARSVVVEHPDVSEVLTRVRAEFEDLDAPRTTDPGPLSWDALIAEFRAVHDPNADAGLRIPTPWFDIDALLGGLFAGRQYVFGGRPGAGKSTAALNIAMHAAALQHPTLVISKEMPTVDVTGRILSAAAGVPVGEVNSRRLSEKSRRKIDAYLDQAGRPPITVDAKSRSITGVRSLVRGHHHRHGLELLVVDYLQLVQTDKPGRTRNEEIAEISRQLKALALELGIVSVIPSQLNRASLQRPDAVPTMADLRESGSIEQDADAVVLLHRPPRNDPRDGEIDFIIDKNRHGPTGTITCHWRGGYATIADPRDAA
jgi:replicative DNA helicase